jgi:hypothetical protein
MGATLTTQSPASCTGSVPARIRDVPRRLRPIYLEAGARFGLGTRGPTILAGINKVETNFGRNLATSSSGAIGWMQFLPSTWRIYGVDGDGDGRKDPFDPADAINGAAKYLRASGAPGNWNGAIFAYNHASWYVNEVLGYARRYGDLGQRLDERCVSVGGGADLKRAVRLASPRAFTMLPSRAMAGGRAPEAVDARLYPDVIWMFRTHDLRVVAAREAGHHTHGDGTAVDLVPAGSQAVRHWHATAERLARDLGWTPGCGASGSRPACKLVSAIQFVGYNGYPGHGDPNHAGSTPHIHVSWVSSSFGSAALSPPPAWVYVFPTPGGVR